MIAETISLSYKAVMITDQHRVLLFLLVCIPVRAAIAYAAKEASPTVLKVMGVIGIIASLSLFLIWATDSRKEKGAFGGDVWWANYRLLHAILIFLFSTSALMTDPNSWKWLAADVSIGLALFGVRHGFA